MIELSITAAKGTRVEKIPLDVVMAMIASTKFKQIIDAINNSNNPDKIRKLKVNNLLMALFAGVLIGRTDDDMVNPNGIFVGDIDFNELGKNNKPLAKKAAIKLRKLLRKVFDDCLLFDYLTPSGGVKFAFRTDVLTTDPCEYQGVYKRLMSDVKKTLIKNGADFMYLEFDTTTSNISQGNFLSYDPTRFYNPNAAIYPAQGLLKQVQKSLSSQNLISPINTSVKPKVKIKPGTSDEEINLHNRKVHYEDYNRFVLDEILYYFGKNDALTKKFLKAFELHKKSRTPFFNLMCALNDALPEWLAKDYLIKFVKLAGIYNPAKLNREYKYITTPKHNINYIISRAKKVHNLFETRRTKMIDDAFDMNFAPQAHYNYQINKYLVEIDTQLYQEIQNHNHLQIVSQTGSGKTHFSTKVLPEKFNEKVILAVPFNNLANELKATGISTIQGGDKHLVHHIPYNKRNVMVSTYDSVVHFEKIINPQDYILVIDEIHLLHASIGFRPQSILNLIEFAKKFKKVVGLTGTPIPVETLQLSNFFRQFHTVSVQSATVKEHRLHFIHSQDTLSTITDMVSNNAKRHKVVAYLNNKPENIKLHESLKAESIDSIILNADTKKNKGVTTLLANNKIADKHQVMIGTASMRDGINILNPDVGEVHVKLMQPVRDIVQLVARARVPKSLDVYIHLPKKNYLNINNNYEPKLLYDELNEHAQKVCDDVNDILLPFLHEKKGGLISEDDFDLAVNYASRLNEFGELSDVFELNLLEQKATINNDVLVYHVLSRIDEAEKANPFLFARQFVKYGFALSSNIIKTELTEEDKKNNWRTATAFVKAKMDSCTNPDDYFDLLNVLKSSTSIKTCSTIDNRYVISDLKSIASRVEQLQCENYKVETALKYAMDFYKDSGFIKELIIIKNYALIIKGKRYKIPLLNSLEQNGIIRDITKEVGELRTIIQKAYMQIGIPKNDTKLQPTTVLSEYFDIGKDEAKDGNTTVTRITIKGYKKPRRAPDNFKILKKIA